MLSISIQQLSLSVFLGVHDWEQKRPRVVTADITFTYNENHSVIDEDLSSVIDYYQISSVIRDKVATNRFKLLETLAAAIAHWLFEDSRISAVDLTITKPNAIPGANSATVRLHQTRK